MCAANGKDQSLRIGWASGSITPDKPVLLDGQFRVRVSTHVDAPLTATALAVEKENGDAAILMSCDMVGVNAEVVAEVREALGKLAPDFDPKYLIISATHTHTAMVLLEDKYVLPEGDIMRPSACRAFFVERMADLAAQAWQQRAPGGVSWAYEYAVVGRNRRAVFENGSAKMYPKTDVPEFVSIEGYDDHGVNLLFTWDLDEKLTGAIVNIACPSQETEGENYISADFWHEARIDLRKRLGQDIPVLPQCAPAGDQSPHLIFNKPLQAAVLERKKRTSRQIIGERIGRAVEEGFAVARENIEYGVPFAHHVETLPLPKRLVTDEEYAMAKEELAALKAGSEEDQAKNHSFINRNQRVIDRYEVQTAEPNLPVDLHVLRLGDAAFANNPFELFLDFGIRIKARSRALVNFLMQITCGYDGYLPTRKAMEARLDTQEKAKRGFSGNYGAGVASNKVGYEGGQVLVDRTVACIDEIWAATEAQTEKAEHAHAT